MADPAQYGSVNTTDGFGPHTTTVTLDSGSGNNRLLIIVFHMNDTNAAANTATFDPGGADEIAMNALLGLTKHSTDDSYIQSWYLLDTDLPASSGSYNVDITHSLVLTDTYTTWYYYEGVTQSAPTNGTAESNSTATPSISTGASASDSVIDAWVSSATTPASQPTQDSGQTLVLSQDIGASVAFASFSTGKTSPGWTYGDSNSYDAVGHYILVTPIPAAATTDIFFYRRVPRTRKPENPQIDFGNAFSRGLVAAWLFTSDWRRNLVTGERLVNSENEPVPSITNGERTLTFTEDSVSTSDANLKADDEYTVLVRFNTTDSATGTSLFEPYNNLSANAYPYAFRISAGNVFYIARYDSTNQLRADGLSQYNDGKTHTALGTFTDSELRLYIDGSYVSNDTSPATTGSVAGDDLHIGSNARNLNNWDGNIAAIYIWRGRVFSDAEAIEITKNPYQLLAPINQPLFISAAAATTDTFFYRRISRTRKPSYPVNANVSKYGNPDNMLLLNGNVKDAYSNNSHTVTGASPIIGKGGRGYNFRSGQTDRIDLDVPTASSEYTWIIVFEKFSNVGTTGPNRVHILSNGVEGITEYQISCGNNFSGTPDRLFISGSGITGNKGIFVKGVKYAHGAYTPPLNEPIAAVFTCTGVPTITEHHIGGIDDGASQQYGLVGNIYFYACLPYAMSDAQAADLSKNIWKFLEDINQPVFISAAAAAASTASPLRFGSFSLLGMGI